MKVLCEKSVGCKSYGCLHHEEHIRVESCQQGCILKEKNWHKHRCSNKLLRKQKLEKINQC